MARYVLKSAPEASRLVTEAEVQFVLDFLLRDQFTKVFGEYAQFSPPAGVEDDELHNAIVERLKDLPPDRLRHIESEARRITALADPVPEVLLQRLAEVRLDGALPEFKKQRDALARSFWSYLRAERLFANAERALQMQHYRDHGKLYDAYELEAPVPMIAEGIDAEKLGGEIAERLHLDESMRSGGY